MIDGHRPHTQLVRLLAVHHTMDAVLLRTEGLALLPQEGACANPSREVPVRVRAPHTELCDGLWQRVRGCGRTEGLGMSF